MTAAVINSNTVHLNLLRQRPHSAEEQAPDVSEESAAFHAC
jgi:hypothetical protein